LTSTAHLDRLPLRDALPIYGLCFSPDYSLLYVADTGARETKVWDVAGTALRNGRQFVRLEQPVGGPAAADGIRCDADGNIWAGADRKSTRLDSSHVKNSYAG